MRKLAEIRRYPALAHRPEDRRDLRALGLWRTRILGVEPARRLTREGNPVITPRLSVTRGEPVRVTLGDYEEMDCFDELFVEQIYQLSDVPFIPDLVADCGGFHGYFCALASGAFGDARIVCFEPNPEHQAALSAQLKLLSRPVQHLAAAVGTADGTARFSGHGMGGAIVAGTATDENTVSVAVMDFPRWLSAQKSRALVWKLDIEGAEAELLPAALHCLPPRTALFLETHHPEARCLTLLSAYADAGFSIREIRRRQMEDSTYIEWFLLRDIPS